MFTFHSDLTMYKRSRQVNNEEVKDQGSTQSNTTPDLGHHMGKVQKHICRILVCRRISIDKITIHFARHKVIRKYLGIVTM